MIQSFADRMTEDIFHGAETKAARGIPRSLWAVARRKLDARDAAADVQDLRAPPGNRLERLRGSLQGLWSTRINDPFRIVFRVEHGTAHEVRITDSHQEFVMTPKHRPPTPPGEILLEDFLKPLGLTQVALAAKMGVPIQRINTLIHGKRGVTAETALLLAAALDTTPEFWMNLQTAHDLWHARRALRSAG